MFGLDKITWGQFAVFILIALGIWYGGVLLYAFTRQKDKRKSPFYEDADGEEGFDAAGLEPVKVSFQSFPSQLLPYPNENIPLEVVYYEDTGPEEGYILDELTRGHHPALLQKMNVQQL
ncbi:hypothetical protein SAMN05444274_101141 [Mariniphaga anaerophila]|uniref:Uncharacterized protein n=1 Tax=Mariniphaga anaerophila TaxID=1484053 RepID=A0A1M4STG8_9BACT|nr:hypothetical protein [Mariniphaga anaerophila]SHE35465.1 hypothetical protein SAMN05444274_101141 [Mariniphaga anaerophila]